MSETENFLDYSKSARRKGTHKSYKRGLGLFEEYYGKTQTMYLKKEGARAVVVPRLYERITKK